MLNHSSVAVVPPVVLLCRSLDSHGAGVGPGTPYNPISSAITTIGGGGSDETQTSKIADVTISPNEVLDWTIDGWNMNSGVMYR